MVPVIDLPNTKKRPLLERVVFRGLVFNMSWEDPEMDRQAFQLTPDDVVLSITSAGCNPLNLLCQNPKQLHCVDGNPVQNAVMELKLAAIRELDYELFFDIFAATNPERIRTVYRAKLRHQLSERSQKFWDKNLRLVAKGLYNFGRTGLFCRILRKYLSLIGVKQEHLDALFECRTLEQQQDVYAEHIGPRLWRAPSKLFIHFKPFMFLAGVHPKQLQLIDENQNLYEYLKDRIEHVLTQVPAYENYFLSQAATGKFRGNRVPPYLLESNFESLRSNLDRVQLVNGWLKPYLDSLPAGSVHKFNLLDIFDWMPAAAFSETMESVLRAAAPGATLIYRSGSYRLDPPEVVRPHLHHHAELSQKLHAIDRSGTYGSFYVLSVKNTAAA